jgi:hypothetical protein
MPALGERAVQNSIRVTNSAAIREVPSTQAHVSITNNLDSELRWHRTPGSIAPRIGFATNREPPRSAHISHLGARGEGRSGAARLRAS